MRTVLLLLALSLLLPLHAARAQERVLAPAPPSLAAALSPPAALAAPVEAPDPLSQPVRARRDRGKGALYGLGVGALVGGVGLAAANYLGTRPELRSGAYTRMSFVTGAVVGGAAGAVLGAIVGVPEREESQAQVRLNLVPELPREGRVGVSVSLPSW